MSSYVKKVHFKLHDRKFTIWRLHNKDAFKVISVFFLIIKLTNMLPLAALRSYYFLIFYASVNNLDPIVLKLKLDHLDHLGRTYRETEEWKEDEKAEGQTDKHTERRDLLSL